MHEVNVAFGLIARVQADPQGVRIPSYIARFHAKFASADIKLPGLRPSYSYMSAITAMFVVDASRPFSSQTLGMD
jgi:hypothetical protein